MLARLDCPSKRPSSLFSELFVYVFVCVCVHVAVESVQCMCSVHVHESVCVGPVK